MNEDKRKTVFTIGLTLVLLVGSVAVTVWADPFFQYHKPLQGMSYPVDNVQYKTAGIAKNWDYTAALVGSSMASNFSADMFADHAINLSLQGSGEAAKARVASAVLENHPDLETVYWGLDSFYLSYEADILADKEYLYNDNYLDDTPYVLNKSVLFSLLDMEATDDIIDLEVYRHWNRGFEYSERRVLEDSTINCFGDVRWSNEEIERYTNIALENIRSGILSLAEEYPGTEFAVFYTPASVCDWKSTDYRALVEIEKQVVEELLTYDNIVVYGFQNDRDIATNLFLYKDIKHYSEYVNDWMAECMNHGTHVLDKSNYESELDDICTMVETYDWEYLINKEGTYRDAATLEEYLRLLKDENCIIIAEAHVDVITEEMLGTIDTIRNGGFAEMWLSEEGKVYYGCVKQGKQTVFEDIDAEELNEQIVYENVDINFMINEDSYVSGIYVNGVQYRKNTAEMNLVIWDVEKNRVTDAVGVDLETGEIVWQKYMDKL